MDNCVLNSSDLPNNYESKYKDLFETMVSGFALLEMIYDDDNNVIDCRYIETNPAHEKITKLKSKDLIGNTLNKCIPNLEDFWLEMYNKVDKTGKTVCVENYVETAGFNPKLVNEDNYQEIFDYCKN